MSKRNRVQYQRGDDPRLMASPRRIRRAAARGKVSRASSRDPRGAMIRIAPTRRRGKKR